LSKGYSFLFKLFFNWRHKTQYKPKHKPIKQQTAGVHLLNAPFRSASTETLSAKALLFLEKLISRKGKNAIEKTRT
jgi:hypothetical protein